VNLVHDHGCDAREEAPRTLRGQKNEERLGRRDQHVRRRPQHRLTLRGGRIAGAHRGANRLQTHEALVGQSGQRRKRLLEVLAHVVGKRLERRDVHDERTIRQRSVGGAPEEVVERKREGRERLARAGRGRDKDVLAGTDRRPTPLLRLGGCAEGRAEPLADERMKLPHMLRNTPRARADAGRPGISPEADPHADSALSRGASNR
jgi:hypothetical protein